jgi:hypothetical protein
MKRHGRVLLGLLVIVVGLSLVVWFHPTAGYAKGGILSGADLRRDMIHILCWLAAAFALGSTAVIAAARSARPWLRYLIGYLAGVATAAIAAPILDRFY